MKHRQGYTVELCSVHDPSAIAQACLRDKVDASDVASLMSTSGDSDEAASLMPKLLEIQTKLHSLEGKAFACHDGKQLTKNITAQIGAVPQDVQDQISTLRKSIDTQTEQMSTVKAGLIVNL